MQRKREKTKTKQISKSLQHRNELISWLAAQLLTGAPARVMRTFTVPTMSIVKTAASHKVKEEEKRKEKDSHQAVEPWF